MQNYIPELNTTDYLYELPAHRIAAFPLAERDASKLLVADCTNAIIHDDTFRSVAVHIPSGSLMIVNNTKVIHARLAMQKPTGGAAEVFLNEPYQKQPLLALQETGSSEWRCIIGGKNIGAGMELQSSYGDLRADIISKDGQNAVVRFRYSESDTFAELLAAIGNVPIPPYLKRNAEQTDEERYQTVYAQNDGSVAAPTAGLHFTERVFASLTEKEISITELTLHVGLGTFEPLKATSVTDHAMHKERLHIHRNAIGSIATFFTNRTSGERCVCVGTTSIRTIETLYWLGVRILRGESPDLDDANVLLLDQWDCYRLRADGNLPAAAESFRAVCNALDELNRDAIEGETRLIIIPGYTPMVCETLITNFHQPESTLILLVAAFCGGDFWRTIYNHALAHDYRFLSYGDSSILIGKAVR
ncbi:MAG: S-adenosylmethionine:tRNA ribosyltransferase-isomerase [Candidatus Kapabacteria bacterium]|nr:S-adenosylmethionine:tRNA ribosyltransferase-isomerase [Candidatus Kapabacteria bacterium]